MTVSVVSVLPAASRSFFIRNRVASVLRAVGDRLDAPRFGAYRCWPGHDGGSAPAKVVAGQIEGIPFVRLVKLQLGQSKGFSAPILG